MSKHKRNTNRSFFSFPDFMGRDLYVQERQKIKGIKLNQLKQDLQNLHDEDSFNRAQKEVTSLGKAIQNHCNGQKVKTLLKSPLLKTYALADAILVQHNRKTKTYLSRNATLAVIELKRRQSPIIKAFFFLTDGPDRKSYKRFKNRQHRIQKARAVECNL